MTQPPCLCHVPVGPRLDTVCPLHDGDSPVALPRASERAAPRAEGLERAALEDAIWAYMEDRGEDEHSALNAAHRAFIARLSRPSDERDPEDQP